MTFVYWSPEEDEILRSEYPSGGAAAAQRALAAIGRHRGESSIRARADRIKVRRQRVHRAPPDAPPLVPIDPVDAVYHTPGRYPTRVGRALWRLAESNPTPEVYERERARILEGSRA